MADPTPEASTQADRFPCRQCGANLHFAPGTEQLECPYCGHEETIIASTEPIVEYDLRDGLAKMRSGKLDSLVKDGQTISCESCGAVAVVDTHAQRCAFCDSPSVTVLQEEMPGLVPEAILPFAIESQKAAQAFKAWVQGRWFAPNDLKSKVRANKLRGVYLPYWTFDSSTRSQYQGFRGDHYFDHVSYTDSEGRRQTRTVQRTRWYPASGQVSQFFDDVLVAATSSLHEKLCQSLREWDLSQLYPFSASYLSGFLAERYKLPLEDGFSRAKAHMDLAIEASVRMDIGGDVQRITSVHTTHANTTFKQILLPVWVSSYRYRDEVYQFVVNGQNGQVAGRRPWSWIKITLASILGLALLVLIIWAAQRYQGQI